MRRQMVTTMYNNDPNSRFYTCVKTNMIIIYRIKSKLSIKTYQRHLFTSIFEPFSINTCRLIRMQNPVNPLRWIGVGC